MQPHVDDGLLMSWKVSSFSLEGIKLFYDRHQSIIDVLLTSESDI